MAGLNPNIARGIRRKIEAEYRLRRYRLGWRFLLGPEAAITTSPVAVVTLNPGGAVYEKPRWCPRKGSAYVTECWKGKRPGEEALQCEMRKLFACLGYDAEEIFAAYFVPFRSRSWSALPEAEAAEAFSLKIWKELLPHCSARLWIAMGQPVARMLKQLLQTDQLVSEPSGWGNVKLRIYKRTDSDLTLICIPHLSRYRLFSGKKSGPVVREFFAAQRREK